MSIRETFSKLQNLWRSSLLSKCWRFHPRFQKYSKKLRKIFCFWDNSIWIGIAKLSLLRTGYFSSAANLLTRSPRIWSVKNRDFFQFKWLGSDQWIGKRCCDVDFNSASKSLPYCLSKGPLKRDVLDIYLTKFSEAVISEIQNLWGSYFAPNLLKFNLNFKKAAKNKENLFCLWDNCIWIGIVKLSLVRTGYILSAANMLTSSPNIWHVKKRDVFQLNWLGSDQ